MLLVISTGTFIVLATGALLLWAGLVLFVTGRSRAKKTARPTSTLHSFFQPTAGKFAVDVPIPMASYKRSELLPLARNGHNVQVNVAAEPVPTPTLPTTIEPELDDPSFAPADKPNPVAANSPVTPSTVANAAAVPTSGYQLTIDRQLLSRLLSDDTLCDEFEEVRALTLARQRETGRSYAALFREAVADKPADVQAVLLNLLTEDEEEDFDRALPTYP